MKLIHPSTHSFVRSFHSFCNSVALLWCPGTAYDGGDGAVYIWYLFVQEIAWELQYALWLISNVNIYRISWTHFPLTQLSSAPARSSIGGIKTPYCGKFPMFEERVLPIFQMWRERRVHNRFLFPCHLMSSEIHPFVGCRDTHAHTCQWEHSNFGLD